MSDDFDPFPCVGLSREEHGLELPTFGTAPALLHPKERGWALWGQRLWERGIGCGDRCFFGESILHTFFVGFHALRCCPTTI